MATATAAAGASEMRIVIPNVAWDISSSLAASDCAVDALCSDDKGMLEIMSPSIEHEWFHPALGPNDRGDDRGVEHSGTPRQAQPR